MLTILRWFAFVKIRVFGINTTVGRILEALKLAEEAYRTLLGDGASREAAKEDGIDTVAVALGWRTPPPPWADTLDRHTAGGG